VSAAGATAPLRSWLFVPGDSERKQAKALESAADALILDLEDSVDPAQRPLARRRLAELLPQAAAAAPKLWVRVSSPDGQQLDEDLTEVCARALPAGIVLPKVSAVAQIVAAAGKLASLEVARGARPGVVRLLVLATETPAGLLALPQLPRELGAQGAVLPRLAGLTWGAEDLSAALGARGKRESGGGYTFTFQLARTHTLLAAAALGVQAVDGVHTQFRDLRGLERELAEARRDGFSGKLAIHPDQVAPINAAFTPSAAELEHARRVLAAFETAGNAGVVSLEGQMLDRPHLLLARRILAAVKA
jgi:citrate lyase subunit beta/citryl-CoA lyase